MLIGYAICEMKKDVSSGLSQVLLRMRISTRYPRCNFEDETFHIAAGNSNEFLTRM